MAMPELSKEVLEETLKEFYRQNKIVRAIIFKSLLFIFI